MYIYHVYICETCIVVVSSKCTYVQVYSNYCVLSSYNIVFVKLVKSNSSYEEKVRAGNSSEKVMFQLLWDVDSLKKLDEKIRALQTATSLLDSRLQEVIRGVFRWKRTPASHMFVMMVSSELRNHKPYAVPNMRQMITLLVTEMNPMGMKIAGTYTVAYYKYYM